MAQLSRRRLLQGALLAASAALLPARPGWSETETHVHPFRFSRELNTLAQASGQTVLDAGTGTPNFIHLPARYAHTSLYQAALRMLPEPGLNPPSEGLAKAFKAEVKRDLAIEVLDKAFEGSGLEPDVAADQLFQMLMGNSYAGFMPLARWAAQSYLEDLLFTRPVEGFHLLPTAGASEGLELLFQELRQPGLYQGKARVAEVVPTFSPFLFSPELKGQFDIVPVRLQSQGGRWVLSRDELSRLADPRVKVCYLVDPGNPLPGSLSSSEVQALVQTVKNKNPELLILADLVYSAFPEKCHPLIQELPLNTVGICSWSKHFGAPGWRLGALLVHEECVLNRRLARPLHETLRPGRLSLPQQGAMTVFSLAQLTEQGKEYTGNLRKLLRRRWEALHHGLGLAFPEDPGRSHFFALVDLAELAGSKGAQVRGDELDYFRRLASKFGTICLPGSGFSAPPWTARVSLASLTQSQCASVGRAMVATLPH